MGLAHNQAIWVVLSAIGIYWFTVLVMGSDFARDSVDIASIFMSLVVALRLLPDAIDRFFRGGGRAGWQLLMGNVLWLLGWACFCAWTYIYRGDGRPQWMTESPINGFFKFWILGGIVLSHFATTPDSRFLSPSRAYYIGIGVAAGILIGVASARYFTV